MTERRQAFSLSTGQDTGGWGWRVKEALERHGREWSARAMAATRTYLAYPEDLPYRRELARSLYAEADVVHLHNAPAGWQLYDDGAGKPAVLQHHGTMFREGHEVYGAEARRIGMVQIASTLDLTLLEPDVEWVPVPYDLAQLQRLREQHRADDGVLRVAHAPTNRAVKGTEHFLQVFARLAGRYGARLELIEYTSWRQCLIRKARADVFYDQLELGYGCNAVEAWGMGIPVVAGAADPQVRAAMVARWGRLPFAEATTDTLEAVLGQLLESRAAREEYAQLGREHFDRWHDERAAAPILEQVYSAARPVLPGPARPVRGARARGDRHARAAERAERQQRSLQRALERQQAVRARLR